MKVFLLCYLHRGMPLIDPFGCCLICMREDAERKHQEAWAALLAREAKEKEEKEGEP